MEEKIYKIISEICCGNSFKIKTKNVEKTIFKNY